MAIEARQNVTIQVSKYRQSKYRLKTAAFYFLSKIISRNVLMKRECIAKHQSPAVEKQLSDRRV